MALCDILQNNFLLDIQTCPQSTKALLKKATSFNRIECEIRELKIFCAEEKFPTLWGLKYPISWEVRTVTPAYKFSRCLTVTTNLCRSTPPDANNRALQSLNNPQNRFWHNIYFTFNIISKHIKFNKKLFSSSFPSCGWLNVVAAAACWSSRMNRAESEQNTMHHFMCSCFSFKIMLGICR